VKKTGNLLKGQAIKSINFAGIEEAVMHQPYVASAQVYATMEGDVVIRVLQRQPVLRVFSQHGESYYLDASGTMLPLNPGYPARVPVASGFIDEPLVRNKNYSVDSVRAGDSLRYHAVMNNLFRLASYIACSPFLKAQVEQVYVDRDGEMELIPRVGNHIILMGRADDLDDKFTRLMVFYRLGLNSTGWDKYQIINIKYKHQVVCSKI
jgi:cell division protein FtsQ